MIAANYHRHADALIRQMELDFSGDVKDEKSRAAWWKWLMKSGKPQALTTTPTPTWLIKIRKAAQALARAIKAACIALFC